MNPTLASRRGSACASLSLLGLLACSPVDALPPGEKIPTTVARAPSDAVPAADQRALTDAQLSFGWSIRATALPSDRNAMLSPFSVHTALTMAHLGARGATAEGLASLLRTGPMGDRALDAYNAVERALVARRTAGVVLRTANAVFARKGLGFERSFVDGLSAYFPVGLSALDFAADSEGARTGINGWVSAQTDGRIPALFAPGSMNADTTLVLVNAMYFNGPWRYAFERSQTQDRRFTLADGAVVSVPKMIRSMPVRSARGEGWRFQLQAGALLFPDIPMSSMQEAWYQLSKLIGMHSSLDGVSIPPGDWLATSFIIGLDLEKASTAPGSGNAAFTGMSTRNAGDTLRFAFENVTPKDAASTPQRMYITLHYDLVVELRSEGVVLLD